MNNTSRITTIRTGDDFGDTSPDVTYILNDHLGSSNTRVDENGTLIDREEYYPFGDSSLRTWSKKSYRYVGKERDEESGLYYYGARYYAAWTCRFVSVDPLAYKYAQLTPFNYADNDPIGDKDIDGNQSQNTDTSPQGGQEQVTSNSNKPNNINPPLHLVPPLPPGSTPQGSDTSSMYRKNFATEKQIEQNNIGNSTNSNDNINIATDIIAPFAPDLINSAGTYLENIAEAKNAELKSKGVLTGTDMKNYQSEGLTKEGEWRNKGNKYYTTKGQNVSSKFTRSLNLFGDVLKTAPIGEVFSIAEFALTGDPFALLPIPVTSMTEDYYREINSAHLNAAIESGYSDISKFLSDNKIDPEVQNLALFRVDAKTFDKVFFGEITNRSELMESLNSATMDTPFNFAVLIDVSNFKLLAGYYKAK